MTPVDSKFVDKIKAETAESYSKRWSGFGKFKEIILCVVTILDFVKKISNLMILAVLKSFR
jgi:hypothetical protein